MTRIKICGLKRPSDVEAAIELGADYLGFVLEPTSPRFFGREASEWRWLDSIQVPKVAVFGEFIEVELDSFDIVQSRNWLEAPKSNHRHFHVIRLGGDEPVEPVSLRLRPGDAIVLDAFHPVAHGGTGIRVDWDLASSIVQSAPDIRVILAGGLTPDNVQEAITKVKPYAVDVSSGIESEPGVKDVDLMRSFIEAARSS